MNFKNFNDYIKKRFPKLSDVYSDMTDEDGDDEVISIAEANERQEKFFKRRIMLIVIIAPVLFFILKTIYDAKLIYDEMVRQEQLAKLNANKKNNFDLKLDSDYAWKVLKDKEITEIKSNISKLHEKFDNTTKAIKSDINASFAQIKEFIQNSQKRMASKNSEQINLIKTELEKKINSIKVPSIQTQKNISLTNLPPLPKLNTLNKYEQDKKDLNSSKKVNLKIAKRKKKKEKIRVSYTVKEYEIKISTSSFSSLNSQKNKKQEDKLPSFTLMPGFARGVLVNGGQIPAILNGKKEPVPIFIRLIDNELIANDDSVTVDGCLIRATAKGDLSKQAVDILLSEISCNLIDDLGNRYKIVQPIQGWVFDEMGSYGVSGRLVTRESKILKAGIPLALVEGMINSISNISSNSLITTQDGQKIFGTGFLTATQTTTEQILKKFTDYYVQMLDALNPVIEIRPGRRVTIAFKGGEQLKLTKYEPINTNYFEEIEDE